jgi:hypothetical protein
MASISLNHCYDWRNTSYEQNGVMDCPLGRKMMTKVEQPALGDDLLARCASGAAIAIAQHQKARSFELRAALALAKFYQSSGRAADARAVLAPALGGFAPTPEFPEIAEAQAFVATLAL